MGGCASKPKEFKAVAAGAPAPEPAKEETVTADIVVVEETKQMVVEEAIGDDTVDEHGIKRRSLSNLFKESEEGKGSAVKDETPAEPVKQESSESVKASDEFETKPEEAEKIATPAEQTPDPVSVDVSVKAEAEKAIAMAQSVEETEKPEEKKLEEHELTIETQKSETPEVKKTEEEKPVTETQNPETPKEKKPEEEKQSTETQKLHTEEEKTVAETKQTETTGEKKIEEKMLMTAENV